ncbi:GAF domain-containing protein [Streptomyces sp. NPDC007251]|uniref:GAF domain-containing protein n=1 Tax=Streptomyces sp. NPDC007251 TaxID=3154483 RepID=UPI0033EAC633
MTCLGGLGALVHRSDLVAGRLRLVAASGLARQSVGAWADLPYQQDVAPAHAMQHGAFVWVAGDSLGVGAAGTAAIPLPGAGGPVGVLSVLTAGPGEPDEARRSLLRALAGWASVRLGYGPRTSPGPAPLPGAERSIRIGELTTALADAVTSRDVVQAVADFVLPPFSADGLVLHILEGGRLHVVGAAGYQQEFLSRLEGMSHVLAAHGPMHDVVRSRTPRFIESKAELSGGYPTVRYLMEASPKEAWAFLPMMASGRVIGLCVVYFSEPRSFSDEERTLLTALSCLVGQSLERARLYDVEHARAQELQRGLLPCGRWKQAAWAAPTTPASRRPCAARSPTACGTSLPKSASPWSPCLRATPPSTARTASHRSGTARPPTGPPCPDGNGPSAPTRVWLAGRP